VRTSTIVMIGFAVVFGLLAVFLANSWLNNQAAERMKSMEAQRKAGASSSSIVVARRTLHFGDVLSAVSLREMPWPENALPAGAFAKISELTAKRRIVLTPIAVNEAILASKITGPGQRATLSALLHGDKKAVTIRVNDVEGVAGFVLPGDHVDVVLTHRIGDKTQVNDVLIQNARVLAVDQTADQSKDKPSVARSVTLEVSESDGQKLALAAQAGTLSLLLREAGDVVADATRRLSTTDLGRAPRKGNSRFATIVVLRPGATSMIRSEYNVPIERSAAPTAANAGQHVAHE
jgi:pilus assembly protein CpaB